MKLRSLMPWRARSQKRTTVALDPTRQELLDLIEAGLDEHGLSYGRVGNGQPQRTSIWQQLLRFADFLAS